MMKTNQQFSMSAFYGLFSKIRYFLLSTQHSALSTWDSRLKKSLLLAVVISLCCIPPLLAQTDSTGYIWQAANLALRYPSNWADPQTAEQETEQVLLLSSVAEATPDNPPDDAPFLLLKRIPLTADLPDLYDVLRDELANFNITPIAPLPANWFNTQATEIIGTNANQTQFGTARIVLPSDDPALLLIIGRAPYEQREALRTQFHLTANSLTRGQNITAPEPAYGVLWQTQSLMSDGPNAFANVSSIASGANDTFWIVDGFAGAIQFDMQTGSRLAAYPFRTPARPTAIAIAPDGTPYVADLLCRCILRWRDEKWESISDAYVPDAPYSLTIAPNGTLYATDVDANGMVFIRAVTAEGESQLLFETPLREQPLLTTDLSGRVLVLTTQGDVLGLEGAGFTSLYALQLTTGSNRFTGLTTDAAGRLVIATERSGIIIINADGTETTRIVPPTAAPFPPLALRGLVIGTDGTLYTAEGENGVSLLRALSQKVLPGRTGTEFLQPAQPAVGSFDNDLRQQVWFFEAERGAIVDITTFARQDAFNLDLALRLLEPDGDEVAFVDNMEPSPDRFLMSMSNPLLYNFELEETGLYTVIIERIIGTGAYDLSVALQQTIELAEAAPTSMTGQLSDAVPLQRFAFQGRGGQTLTITLTTDSPQLDPVLFLRDSDGEIVAQNDNALDQTLRQNAQIVEIELPQNGIYVIEATRFRGFGQYQLEIQPNE